MSSSVLGLGAAAMGAASLGADSLKNKPPKTVKVPQPSAKDYQLGQMGLIWGDTNKFYSSNKEMIKAAFGSGPVIGGTGEFYYGAAPLSVPKGYTALRGPDISVQGRNVNSGSTTNSIETYRLVPLQQLPQQQKTSSSLDLSQGGRDDRLNRADIKHAMKQGMSIKDIRKTAEAEGIRMSAKAKARLYKAKKDKA